MEISGLMAQSFKLFLGNPDVMIAQITFVVFITIALTVLEMSKETET